MCIERCRPAYVDFCLFSLVFHCEPGKFRWKPHAPDKSRNNLSFSQQILLGVAFLMLLAILFNVLLSQENIKCFPGLFVIIVVDAVEFVFLFRFLR